MNLNDYYYIAAIAKYRNISKAAEELYVSQPYLSKYLAKIEGEYHAHFFDRTVQPLRITQAGQCYLEYFKKIVTLQKCMAGELEQIVAGDIGSLSVGIATLTCAQLIPYIVPMFTPKYPGIKLQLVEKNTYVLMDLLLAGKIDLAIMNLPAYPKDVKSEFVLRENIYLAVPPNHKLMEKYHPEEDGLPPVLTKQDILQLNHERFVLAYEKQSMGIYERQILNYYDITPREEFITESIQAAYRLTAQNFGFSFIGELSLHDACTKRSPGLFRLDREGWTRTLSVAYLANDYISEPIRCFIHCLQTIGRKFDEGYYNGVYGIDIIE